MAPERNGSQSPNERVDSTPPPAFFRVNVVNYLQVDISMSTYFSCLGIIKTQRWKFKLSVPGLYRNTIPTLPGLPWLSSNPKLSVEHNYIGFVLIL